MENTNDINETISTMGAKLSKAFECGLGYRETAQIILDGTKGKVSCEKQARLLTHRLFTALKTTKLIYGYRPKWDVAPIAIFLKIELLGQAGIGDIKWVEEMFGAPSCETFEVVNNLAGWGFIRERFMKHGSEMDKGSIHCLISDYYRNGVGDKSTGEVFQEWVFSDAIPRNFPWGIG